MPQWVRSCDALNLKLVDGVASKSSLGGMISLLTGLLITTLCISEFFAYVALETVSHMTLDGSSSSIDASRSSAVKISLHATFFHLTCEGIKLDVEATRGDPTVETRNQVVKSSEGSGCTLKGDLEVGKVGGNFHIATGTFGLNQSPLIQLNRGMITMSEEFTGANLSHTIHYLSFGKIFPGLSNPLQNVVNIVPTDVGQYQFHIKVIPTIYKYLRRTTIFSNQYSVNEQFVRLDLLSTIRSSG